MKIIDHYRIIKYFFFTAVLAAVFASCASAPSSSSGMSAASETSVTSGTSASRTEIERRQEAYMSVLRQEGYVPAIDADGDIQFKWQGENFFIVLYPNEPSFVCLLKPTIKYITSDERQKAAIAIGEANRTTKVAKAFLVTGSTREFISIGAELLLDDPYELGAVLSRMIGVINSSRTRILNALD